MLSVNQKLSNIDAIGIGRKGTIDKPQYLKAPFWTVDTLFFLTPKDNFNLQFLFSLSQRINWLRYNEATGLPSLSKSTIKNIDVKVPNFTEQEKIGKLIKCLSRFLTLQQRKLQLLKQLKKGLYQGMFADGKQKQPTLRFSGFTEDWKQRKLGDLATIVRGASPRPIKDPKWFDSNSEVGWLRISDVTEQNGKIHHLEQHISKLGQEKTRVITTPHLLLSIAASVGKPVINYVKTGVHDGFLIFEDSKFNINFIYTWLLKFQPYWQKYGQPGSQVNLNSDLVRKQLVRVPREEEQKKITKTFKMIDKTISLHQRKQKQLQELKTSLLQNMFI